MKLIRRIVSVMVVSFFIIWVMVIILGGGYGESIRQARLKRDSALVFAHRGIANYYTENSMEGFVQSEVVGFSALEVDVRKTKDHRMVIFHDKSCKRRLGIDEEITDLDFDFVRSKYLLFKNQPSRNKISTLDEVLTRFDSSMIIYLDIKDVNKTIADSLLWLIRKHNAFESVLVADQSIVFLSYIKYKEPRINTVLEKFYGYRAWVYPLIPKNFKPDYFGSFLQEVDDDHVEFLKEHDLLDRKIVYGVERTNLDSVYAYGIPHVIIDYDSALVSLRDVEKNLKHHHNLQQKK